MPLDTRADLLRHAIIEALRLATKVVRGTTQALYMGQRMDVADAAVKTIAELPGDPWKLGEPLPKDFSLMSDLGAPTPPGWCKPSPRDNE
jgi:hypothetical protein